MSLNNRRRIFRSSTAPVTRRRAAMPSPAWLVAGVAGAATVLLVVRLIARPADAPTQTPVSFHVSAAAGEAVVLDGNTLRLGDRIVELAGIVAPARGTVCHGDHQIERDCGSAAANALWSLVRDRAVYCAIDGQSGQGRPVGTCLAGGGQLNRALLLDGRATAATPD